MLHQQDQMYVHKTLNLTNQPIVNVAQVAAQAPAPEPAPAQIPAQIPAQVPAQVPAQAPAQEEEREEDDISGPVRDDNEDNPFDEEPADQRKRKIRGKTPEQRLRNQAMMKRRLAQERKRQMEKEAAKRSKEHAAAERPQPSTERPQQGQRRNFETATRGDFPDPEATRNPKRGRRD